MVSVSIGVPVQNGAEYLEAAVMSLLDQTRAPDEILIAENGSTDSTLRIARGIAAVEPTVSVSTTTEDLGAAANFNSLVHRAEGEFFAWLAADDVWAPGLLEAYVRAHASETIAVAYGTSVYIDESGDRCGLPPDIRWRDSADPVERVEDLLGDAERSHFHCCHPVFGLARRDLLLETGLIRPFGGSDKALIFELSLRGRLTCVPEIFFRRQHPASSVAANRDDVSRRRWFDPTRTGAPMPVSRLAATMVTTTVRAPISTRERFAILRLIGSWLRSDRRARIVAGETKAWLRDALGSER